MTEIEAVFNDDGTPKGVFMVIGGTRSIEDTRKIIDNLTEAVEKLEESPWCDVCRDEGGIGPLDPCPECGKYGPLT